MMLIELFAGTGVISQAFAARGWHCVGVDLRRDYSWPPDIQHWAIDLRELHRQQRARREIHNPAPAHQASGLLWASPPCEEYSLAARRPPGYQPDTTLWEITLHFAEQLGWPYIIENVSGAQRYWGPAAHHFGKVYLWGTGVPALLPQGPRWKDATHKTQHRTYRLRSQIPTELAAAIAEFHTARYQDTTP